SGGVEGEIRRRPVRIDMGAAAGHLAGASRGRDGGALGRGLDLVVERLEALPGDRALERIVDDATRDRALAPVGHADERVAPGAGGAVAVRVGAVGVLRLAAMIGTAFER